MSEYIFDIPDPIIGDFNFTTTIENVPYILRIRWNTPDLAWYFDVSDIQSNPIQTGIKIVLGCFLGSKSTHPLFTQYGAFVACDTSNLQQDAGYNDFGTRVLLKYIPIADILTRIAQANSEGDS